MNVSKNEEFPATGNFREFVAWLLWCANEGYVNAKDRQDMTNWFLEPESQLHPDDITARPHWLAMADEVIAAADARWESELRQTATMVFRTSSVTDYERLRERLKSYGLSDEIVADIEAYRRHHERRAYEIGCVNAQMVLGVPGDDIFTDTEFNPYRGSV